MRKFKFKIDGEWMRVSCQHDGGCETCDENDDCIVPKYEIEKIIEKEFSIEYRCYSCLGNHIFRCLDFKIETTNDDYMNIRWKNNNAEWGRKQVKKINDIEIVDRYYE